jgi:hypothetical protein
MSLICNFMKTYIDANKYCTSASFVHNYYLVTYKNTHTHKHRIKPGEFETLYNFKFCDILNFSLNLCSMEEKFIQICLVI